jgi:pimeloyl-ACP methyl ester carboxylesterase
VQQAHGYYSLRARSRCAHRLRTGWEWLSAFAIARLSTGKRIQVPLQLLWGDQGNLRDAPVLQEWQKRAISVRGHAIPESGHFIPEEQPEQVLQAVNAFADELKLP